MYETTEKSTVHGLKTPHGYKTPHKYPTSQNQDLPKVLLDLANQLYPTGRAYYMQEDKVISKTHEAINVGFIRLIQDALFTLDSSLPDNENFTVQDCELWEYRLGIVTNNLLSVELRQKAILRKMSFSRGVKAGLTKSYIESQLQLAGFDVYIHENKFFENGSWVYKTPSEIIGSTSGSVQYGGSTQYGQGVQYGGASFDVIANLSVKKEIFSVGSNNLWATFFIGGSVLGEYATVPVIREQEFKELVLTLKAAHLVAFTFINYV